MIRQLSSGDPRVIGRYRLVGQLGSGGMGRVFLGLSPGGRPVAIKLIRADLAADPHFRARFQHEVAAARRVSGLYTAAVVDADTEAADPWLATTYVAGPSLAEGVHQNGPLPPESVIRLAAALAESLAAIHAVGVVHRDLKPSNVLLAEDGPRVIDFGISRAAETTNLTHTGFVVGSPGFMSPEQARGKPVGPASDIFCLGSVLVFAATGHSPFGIGDTAALVYRIVHEPPELDGLPPQVRALVEDCLAKDPGQRPTAAAVLTRVGPVQPVPGWLPSLDFSPDQESLAEVFAQPPGPAGSPVEAEPAARSEVEHPSTESLEASPAGNAQAVNVIRALQGFLPPAATEPKPGSVPEPGPVIPRSGVAGPAVMAGHLTDDGTIHADAAGDDATGVWVPAIGPHTIPPSPAPGLGPAANPERETNAGAPPPAVPALQHRPAITSPRRQLDKRRRHVLAAAAALVVAAAGLGAWLTLNGGAGHRPSTQQDRSQAAVALTGPAITGSTLPVTSSSHAATTPATHSATHPATQPAPHPVTVTPTQSVTATATATPRPRPTQSHKTTAPAATTLSVSASGADEYACGTVLHSPFRSSSMWLFTFIDDSSADIGIYIFFPDGSLHLLYSIGPGKTITTQTVRGAGYEIQGPGGCLAALEITAAGQATVS